ncbi:MAG: protein kinase [Sandaracinaceae bacterium]
MADVSAAESSEKTEPRSLGRYEILHELGHGGMANVYLGRVSGPAAFHKWVAIKQIHPHLAKEKHFVDMFLDEARIAASLSHPNVASVLDLGETGGEYYLAMEYLHGEHLGSLAFRGMREWGRVPPLLAAWIVSEAARGLHHAHEARDPEGRPLHLIHRDVSPQNIFITYDGQVKLTDFGVAKAANRLTHTETGHTKGKVAYMAPEQALAGEVDRRLDVFALGTVLWEISVGRRLFKSQTKAQTLMRITSGKVSRPTKIWSDYPPKLEEIVMRALALEPSQRYPTAAAMADALTRFVADRQDLAGNAHLAQVMRGLFAERRVERDRLLRDLIERPADDVTPTEPSSIIEGVDALPDAHSEQSAIVPSHPRKAAPRRLWIGFLVAGAMAAIVGAGAASLLSTPEVPEAPASPMPTQLRIESTPSGARVRLDGVELSGRTPLTLDAVSAGRHHLALDLAGFSPVETEFDAQPGETTRLAYVLNTAAPLSVPAPVPPAVIPAPAPPEPTSQDPPSPTTAPTELARTPRPPRPPTAGRAPRAAGTVTILSLPWASVSIDGAARRATPLRDVSLSPGRHTLRYWVQGTGEPRTMTIDVTSAETATVRLSTR